MSGREVRLRVLFAYRSYDDMIVVAGAADESLWDHAPEAWDDVAKDWKVAVDPDGSYYDQWHDTTVTLPYEVVVKLFESPDIPGEVDAG